MKKNSIFILLVFLFGFSAKSKEVVPSQEEAVYSEEVTQRDSKAVPVLVPAAIAAVRAAYVVWSRSRVAANVIRLRNQCQRLYETYKNKIQVVACVDRCGGQWDPQKRNNCYQILSQEISRNIDQLTAEIDSRMAFFELCAKPGIGNRADGSPWEADEGHAKAIQEKSNARSHCRSIAKRRATELSNQQMRSTK